MTTDFEKQSDYFMMQLAAAAEDYNASVPFERSIKFKRKSLQGKNIIVAFGPAEARQEIEFSPAQESSSPLVKAKVKRIFGNDTTKWHAGLREWAVTATQVYQQSFGNNKDLMVFCGGDLYSNVDGNGCCLYSCLQNALTARKREDINGVKVNLRLFSEIFVHEYIGGLNKAVFDQLKIPDRFQTDLLNQKEIYTNPEKAKTSDTHRVGDLRKWNKGQKNDFLAQDVFHKIIHLLSPFRPSRILLDDAVLPRQIAYFSAPHLNRGQDRLRQTVDHEKVFAYVNRLIQVMNATFGYDAVVAKPAPSVEPVRLTLSAVTPPKRREKKTSRRGVMKHLFDQYGIKDMDDMTMLLNRLADGQQEAARQEKLTADEVNGKTGNIYSLLGPSGSKGRFLYLFHHRFLQAINLRRAENKCPPVSARALFGDVIHTPENETTYNRAVRLMHERMLVVMDKPENKGILTEAYLADLIEVPAKELRRVFAKPQSLYTSGIVSERFEKLCAFIHCLPTDILTEAESAEAGQSVPVRAEYRDKEVVIAEQAVDMERAYRQAAYEVVNCYEGGGEHGLDVYEQTYIKRTDGLAYGRPVETLNDVCESLGHNEQMAEAIVTSGKNKLVVAARKAGLEVTLYQEILPVLHFYEKDPAKTHLYLNVRHENDMTIGSKFVPVLSSDQVKAERKALLGRMGALMMGKSPQ